MKVEVERCPEKPGKNVGWPGLLLAAALCCVIARALFGHLLPGASSDAPDLESPLSVDPAVCQVSRAAALTHARTLEELSDASWERIPFDLREAPRAVARSGEAEGCFRVVGDREAAQRVALKRRTYEADLRRRWSRAKLKLALARRHQDAAAVRREIGALLSLSSQAGDEAKPYRAYLEELDQVAEAALLEATTKED